jgi:RNA-binding protein YlmH
MVCGQTINFCRPEQISTCTAASQKEQAGCHFFEKSRHAERCMYFIFDEYCDCLQAQLSASPRP